MASSAMNPEALNQSWPLPSSPRPIVLIGAGGIVGDAHLPAYRKAGLTVAGIFDVRREAARKTAEAWGIATVFDRLDDAAAASGQPVFDLATPPDAIHDVLGALPDGATVLIQKPMGKDLPDANRIRERCREKGLVAAVNFQLRFSPMMLALRDFRERGGLGEIVDIDVHLNLRTPWELFPFLEGLDRVEIAVHSIHYLDFIRSLVGEPSGVHARTLGHPHAGNIRQTRTSAILDYGERLRCCLSINHNFTRGPDFQLAQFKVEGLDGVAVVKLGLLLNYPTGEPDELAIQTGDGPWQRVPLAGGWFPDAFIGTMANLQRFAAGEDERLETSVEDAWHTMALVEACFQSSARGATPIPAG